MIFTQLNPSYDVKMETVTGKKMYVGRSRNSAVTVTAQTWHRSGSCPKGTIPVRRIQKNNVSKGHSDSNYGRKKPMFFHYNMQLNDSKMLYLLQKNHSVSAHRIYAS